MKTIGKGIVLEQLELTPVLVALVCSGIFVTAATFFKVPVSTSQAIVGGVIGVGYAAEKTVSLAKVWTILECWVICPILTCGLAFGLYHIITWVTRRVGHGHRTYRFLSYLVIGSACYVSYSMGANNVGNAMGPVASLSGINSLVLGLIGGIALAIGTITFGKRVTETVGKGITPLDLTGALAAQLSSAFGIHLFSLMGIPVSTSQAVVGGVVGVGIVKGVGAVSGRKLIEISIGWVAVPTLAGTVAYGMLKLFAG